MSMRKVVKNKVKAPKIVDAEEWFMLLDGCVMLFDNVPTIEARKLAERIRSLQADQPTLGLASN